MSGKVLASIFVFGFTSGLLLFFNNCAQKSGYQASSPASENLAEGVDEVVVPSNHSFKLGDVISEPTIRNISSTLGDAFSAYVGVADGKAMAVPQSREGAVAVGSFSYGSSESERLSSLKDHVLNLCYMRYQSPCVLIAVGNKFSISGSVLNQFFAQLNSNEFSDPAFNEASIQNGVGLLNGQTLSAQNMPVVRYSSMLNDYLSYSGFKSLAISWKGRVMWIGSASGSQQEINRRVLEYCQVKTGEKCLTYASGNMMALNALSQMAWTIPNAGDVFDVEKIPLISESSRTTVRDSAVLTNLNNGMNAVFYISGAGQVSASSSSTKTLDELAASLKTACETSAGSHPCYLYSKNKQVLLDVRKE